MTEREGQVRDARRLLGKAERHYAVNVESRKQI